MSGVNVKRSGATTLGLIGLLSSSFAALSEEQPCRGHRLLPTPRPADSCRDLKPTIVKSPNGALTAFVYPVDPSVNATPDMESRVEVKTKDGRILATIDHASRKGANGYFVDQTQWTRDSQYFVFNLVSSGGHSPWQSPMEVFSVERGAFFKFSELIGGNPTLTQRFSLEGDHTVVATTWTDRNLEKPRPVSVNLKDSIAKLPQVR